MTADTMIDIILIFAFGVIFGYGLALGTLPPLGSSQPMRRKGD